MSQKKLESKKMIDVKNKKDYHMYSINLYTILNTRRKQRELLHRAEAAGVDRRIGRRGAKEEEQDNRTGRGEAQKNAKTGHRQPRRKNC